MTAELPQIPLKSGVIISQDMASLFCMIIFFFVVTINLPFHSLPMFPLYITILLYELIQGQVVSDRSGEGFLWHCGVDTYAIKRMGQKISLHHNSVRHK